MKNCFSLSRKKSFMNIQIFPFFSFSYKANIENLAKLVEDAVVMLCEREVKHVECVIRNKGAKNLRFNYFFLLIS